MAIIDFLNNPKKDKLNEISFNDVGNITDNAGFNSFRNVKKGTLSIQLT